jgi:hypothetical protein
MSSSSALATRARRHAFVAGSVLVLFGWTTPAAGQQVAQGFAVERLYPSAPGGGWFVMDALDMHGGLGGAAGASLGYARFPLRVATSDGSERLAVVAHQATLDFGFAVTYDRYRLSLNFDMPLVASGQSGSLGDATFAAPDVGLGSHPDTLSDARIGLDARILGDAKGPFRLGASAQLLVPSGNRADYVTDGTYRATARALLAGDRGLFTYAGHLGVHVRPLDDASTAGSPRGSELLFGLAGGARVPVCDATKAVVVVGPEFFGATTLRSAFDASTTALEGLLSARVEGTADDGLQMRVKLGVGSGIDKRFGSPDWRVAFGIEVFDHHARSEH